MGTFSKDDLRFEPGSEESISTYVFTHTTSGKPKDKTFCKGCGVPLWTVTEGARSKGQIFLRTALLDKGYASTSFVSCMIPLVGLTTGFMVSPRLR